MKDLEYTLKSYSLLIFTVLTTFLVISGVLLVANDFFLGYALLFIAFGGLLYFAFTGKGGDWTFECAVETVRRRYPNDQVTQEKCKRIIDSYYGK